MAALPLHGMQTIAEAALVGHEHQQRQKPDEPDSDGSVAVQAAPEQVELGGMSALPGLGFDTLRTLQGSIGNAAVGRMVRASNVATAERPTAVSSDTQTAIDAQRAGGQTMPGGVRLHRGAPVQALARSLNANAFTQGRDVFLGPGAGPETLAHEMTHVSQGVPASGAVMREPAGTETKPTGEDKPMQLPAAYRDPNTAPGATMGPEDGEVRYVDRLPTIGEPGIRYVVKSAEQKMAERRYDLSFTMYEKPIFAPNLTSAEIIQRLKGIWHSYHGDIDYDRAENLRLKANREDHWIVGFWSDTFGGVEVPDPEMWNEVGAGPLQAAMAALEASDAVVEEQWKKNEASIQRNIDPALMNNPYIQDALAFDATKEKVNEAIRHLEEARRQIIECENKMERYRHGTIQGAGRAITGIRVSISVLSAAASGNNPLTAGFLGSTDEFFTQVGEMRIGERKDWDFDFGKIAKRGAKDTVTAFVGAVAGGKFSKVLGGKYTQWVYGLSEAELAAQGLTRELLLSKGEQLTIEWISGVGASPFTTTSNVMMDMALDNKVEVHSFGDFAGKVWDDMVQNAEMDGLLKLAGAKFGNGSPGEASTGGRESGTTTTEGGAVTAPMEASGGGGGPPVTSTPESTGGGGGGGEGGRPSSDIGTADTQAMPVQDVGTADTLQMPAESGKGPGDTQPMTAQEIGGLDTQRMASEEIGTSDTVEQPAASDTEPHNIGNAPTQQGPVQPEAGGAAQPPQPAVSTPEGTNAPPEGGAPQGPEGPNHPIPPANGEVQAINDRVEASRIAAQASRENQPVRWVAGGPAEGNRVWQQEYGGQGDAPAAWVDADGRLVVNTNEIPAPVRSADIVSGPLYEPGAAGGGGGPEAPTVTAPQPAGPASGNGGGGSGGGSSGGPAPRKTSQGMGAAGPAGENAPPRPDISDTLPMAAQEMPGDTDVMPAQEITGDTEPMTAPEMPGDTDVMPAQDITGDTELMTAPEMPGDTDVIPTQELAGDTQPMQSQPERRFSETSQLEQPIDRAPENRLSVSGYSGSQADASYGAFRGEVRLQTGEVVNAVVKIFPGENNAKFQQEVAAARAAAATGMGPEYYGVVPVPNGPDASGKTNDLAFAMGPVEGAFAFNGSEAGDPGYAKAQAQSEAAARRIEDHTIDDVNEYRRRILDQGYYYDGEVQGLIGPNGEWRPIDFGGVKALPDPADTAAYDQALRENDDRFDNEIENLERARREAAPDYVPDDPTTRTRR